LPFKIGSFDGLVDSAIIYKRALSPKEIKEHYLYKKQFY